MAILFMGEYMMQHLIIGDKIYTNPPEGTLISWSDEFFYLPDKFTKLVKNNFKICKIYVRRYTRKFT